MLVLIAAGTLSCAPATHAQLPERVERCIPYPTYAQEVNALYPSEELSQTSSRKVIVIDSVQFDGLITLPDPARLKLVDDLKNLRLDASSAGLKEVEEVQIRGAWQDQGYFKVASEVTAKELGDELGRQHIALMVRINEGLQYRLGDLDFEGTDLDAPLAFTRGELRSLFPLQDGDIFDADKVRRSLEVYRKLYGSHGYIDFAAAPDFYLHDEERRISLMIELDEGKQFHVGQVEVAGLDRKTETALRSMIKPGDVFNYQVVEEFMERYKATLPQDASLNDLEIKKNVKEGTASLRFDFFTCPKSTN